MTRVVYVPLPVTRAASLQLGVQLGALYGSGVQLVHERPDPAAWVHVDGDAESGAEVWEQAAAVEAAVKRSEAASLRLQADALEEQAEALLKAG